VVDTTHNLDLFENVGALCDSRPLLELLVEVFVAVLGRVEFVLSNDFDGDLSASLLLQSFVDVGESAVTHLLEEPIVFQTLVDRHLLSLSTLLCDYPLCLFSIVW